MTFACTSIARVHRHVLVRNGHKAKFCLAAVGELQNNSDDANKDKAKVAVQEMDGTKEEVAPLVQQLLIDKTDLLKECFGVQIMPDGCLAALPQLIESYCPDLNRLPYFVLQLARDVDWEEEKACFRGLAQVCNQHHLRANLLTLTCSVCLQSYKQLQSFVLEVL